MVGLISSHRNSDVSSESCSFLLHNSAQNTCRISRDQLLLDNARPLTSAN